MKLSFFLLSGLRAGLLDKAWVVLPVNLEDPGFNIFV